MASTASFQRFGCALLMSQLSIEPDRSKTISMFGGTSVVPNTVEPQLPPTSQMNMALQISPGWQSASTAQLPVGTQPPDTLHEKPSAQPPLHGSLGEQAQLTQLKVVGQS